MRRAPTTETWAARARDGDLVGLALLRAALDEDELRLLSVALAGRGGLPAPRGSTAEDVAVRLRDLAAADPSDATLARGVRAYCDGLGRTPRAAAELVGVTEREAAALLRAARVAEGLDAAVSTCPGWALVVATATGRAARLSAGEQAAAHGHRSRCGRCAAAAVAAAASSEALPRASARAGLGGLVRR